MPRSVLRGIDPHNLKYAPTLQRQLQMTHAPKTQTAPQMPGLGGGSYVRSRPVKEDGEDE